MVYGTFLISVCHCCGGFVRRETRSTTVLLDCQLSYFNRYRCCWLRISSLQTGLCTSRDLYIAIWIKCKTWYLAIFWQPFIYQIFKCQKKLLFLYLIPVFAFGVNPVREAQMLCICIFRKQLWKCYVWEQWPMLVLTFFFSVFFVDVLNSFLKIFWY